MSLLLALLESGSTNINGSVNVTETSDSLTSNVSLLVSGVEVVDPIVYVLDTLRTHIVQKENRYYNVLQETRTTQIKQDQRYLEVESEDRTELVKKENRIQKVRNAN